MKGKKYLCFTYLHRLRRNTTANCQTCKHQGLHTHEQDREGCDLATEDLIVEFVKAKMGAWKNG